jgi:hypothetical protein
MNRRSILSGLCALFAIPFQPKRSARYRGVFEVNTSQVDLSLKFEPKMVDSILWSEPPPALDWVEWSRQLLGTEDFPYTVLLERKSKI